MGYPVVVCDWYSSTISRQSQSLPFSMSLLWWGTSTAYICENLRSHQCKYRLLHINKTTATVSTPEKSVWQVPVTMSKIPWPNEYSPAIVETRTYTQVRKRVWECSGELWASLWSLVWSVRINQKTAPNIKYNIPFLSDRGANLFKFLFVFLSVIKPNRANFGKVHFCQNRHRQVYTG